MRTVKYLVVGMGAMGSAALYHLARRQVPAVGIEQFQIGHALGSSHGFSRIFRDIYYDPLYVELAEAAIPLWQELDSRSREKLMRFTGLLYFARPGNEAFEKSVSVMEALKRPLDKLTAQEVASRFPPLRLPSGVSACFTPQAGLLNVGPCVLAHLEQAQRLGAVIHQKTSVLNIDLSQETPVLDTSEGQFRCERLIISPGPWAPQIIQELALPLRVTRQQEFYFLPKYQPNDKPAPLPVFGDLDTKFYGFPDFGPGFKTADDSLGKETSASEIDRTLDMGKRDQLLQWLQAILPDPSFSYQEGATCMYTVTPDKDFLIGPHPHNPHVIVAAGFSGHGFKFAPLIGKILADLAVDGSTGYPIERFRLDRFQNAADS